MRGVNVTFVPLVISLGVSGGVDARAIKDSWVSSYPSGATALLPWLTLFLKLRYTCSASTAAPLGTGNSTFTFSGSVRTVSYTHLTLPTILRV